MSIVRPFLVPLPLSNEAADHLNHAEDGEAEEEAEVAANVGHEVGAGVQQVVRVRLQVSGKLFRRDL